MFELPLREALILVGIVSGVPLIASSIVGLIVSLVQAATQIQDQTLTYLLKISVVTLMLVIFGDWISHEFVDFLQKSIRGMRVLGNS